MRTLRAIGVTVALLIIFVSGMRAHADEHTEPQTMVQHSVPLDGATIIYAVPGRYSQNVVPSEPVVSGDYAIFSAFSYDIAFTGAPRFALRISVTDVKVPLVEGATDDEFVEAIERTLTFEDPGYYPVKSTVVLGGRRWYHVQWFDGKKNPMSDLYFARLTDSKLLSVAGYYYGKRWFWQSNKRYRKQVRDTVRSVQVVTGGQTGSR